MKIYNDMIQTIEDVKFWKKSKFSVSLSLYIYFNYQWIPAWLDPVYYRIFIWNNHFCEGKGTRDNPNSKIPFITKLDACDRGVFSLLRSIT